MHVMGKILNTTATERGLCGLDVGSASNQVWLDRDPTGIGFWAVLN